MLGIDSAAPGFAKVRVEPHIGALERVWGRVPHPKGMIEVEAKKVPAGLEVKVAAPAGVEVEVIKG